LAILKPFKHFGKPIFYAKPIQFTYDGLKTRTIKHGSLIIRSHNNICRNIIARYLKRQAWSNARYRGNKIIQ
jgi:hypothetical protein